MADRRTVMAAARVTPAVRAAWQNKVEAAFARSDLFEWRRLMDERAAYVGGEHGHVIPLRR